MSHQRHIPEYSVQGWIVHRVQQVKTTVIAVPDEYGKAGREHCCQQQTKPVPVSCVHTGNLHFLGFLGISGMFRRFRNKTGICMQTL
jgi:hypothetical protein